MDVRTRNDGFLLIFKSLMLNEMQAMTVVYERISSNTRRFMIRL